MTARAAAAGAERARRRARRWILAPLLLVAGGCGHAIGPGLDFEPPGRFDFRRPPPCAGGSGWKMPAAPEDVVVRYLGAGGLYVGWRGESLLMSPFFSNPGTMRVALRRMRPSECAVALGLEGVPVAAVGAILAGHSHYDHLGDLPLVAARAPRAALYVNHSGVNALARPYPELVPRLRELEASPAGEWIELGDAGGRRLPFRVLPVRSSHAPHVLSLTLWMRPTKDVATPWKRRRHGALGAGQTYAFVVDLLESAEPGAPVRFRLYVQDAAVAPPLGLPPAPGDHDPAYDLAVVCMASSQWIEGHPQELLRLTRPRHVLVTHYENFLKPWGWERGFVPLLTRGVANGFLRRVECALGCPPPGAAASACRHGVGAPACSPGVPPAGDPCGPSASRWTMPLTGEWLVFRPKPR